MKKTDLKDFLMTYLEKKYINNPQSLIEEILADRSRETAFWFACKEVAFEILQKKSQWYQLSFQIDDRKSTVEDEIVKNLPKWLKNEMAITKHTDTAENLLNWLFKRYINTLKNSTNEKYKIYIKLEVVEFNDENNFVDEIQIIDQLILDRFTEYSNAEKIIILKKVWEAAWDDSEFDIGELEYLCSKYDAPIARSFINCELKIPTCLEKNKRGIKQLIINFEELI